MNVPFWRPREEEEAAEGSAAAAAVAASPEPPSASPASIHKKPKEKNSQPLGCKRPARVRVPTTRFRNLVAYQGRRSCRRQRYRDQSRGLRTAPSRKTTHTTQITRRHVIGYSCDKWCKMWRPGSSPDGEDSTRGAVIP